MPQNIVIVGPTDYAKPSDSENEKSYLMYSGNFAISTENYEVGWILA